MSETTIREIREIIEIIENTIREIREIRENTIKAPSIRMPSKVIETITT